MNRSRRRSWWALAVVWSFGSSAADAQSAATVGLEATRIEYDGFLASGAATLTGALRWDTRSVAIGGQGSWTVFESGNPIFQATGAAAWLHPLGERAGLELSGAAGAYRYADQPATGHLLLRSRIHLFGEQTGGWLGAATGAPGNGSPDIPVELAAGIWSVHQRVSLVGTLTATWLGPHHYMDVAGAAKWSANRVELEARAGARPVARNSAFVGDARTGAWGEVSALVPLAPRVSLALSGGKYQSDPVRGVLGANYVAAGLRMSVGGSDRMPLPAIPMAMRPLLKTDTTSAPSGPRLEIAPGADLHALRVHVAGVASVEVMGDFTGWQILALKRISPSIWEIKLQLTTGVHRLNIRIDGGEWVVPAGARAEPGEFGGAVGVVVVR